MPVSSRSLAGARGWLVLACLAFASFDGLVACTPASDGPPANDPQLDDSGTGEVADDDAGSIVDAGTSADAGTGEDAGTVADAGTSGDAGTSEDAGTGADAGAGGDAGTVGVCGDGHVDDGEACDDGYADACGTCNADCTGAGSGSTCGDGVRCPEREACDDGFHDACGTCNATCTAPGAGSVCGDGARCAETEVCDDGFADACGTCNADCSGAGVRAVCGDGVRCPEREACDDGFRDACGTCNSICSAPGTGAVCGDGEVCPELEFCDDGFGDACGSCNATCTADGTGATCGDGEACLEREACDDGNTSGGDYCDATCAAVTGRCGDGIVQENEVCDDGDADDGDLCSSDCRTLDLACTADQPPASPSGGVAVVGPTADLVPLCDGWAWVGDQTAHAIVLTSAVNGTTQLTLPLTAAPGALDRDVDADVLWVTLVGASALARVDVNTRAVTTIALPSPAIDVAVGDNGWVFASLSTGSATNHPVAIVDGVAGVVASTTAVDVGALLAWDGAHRKLLAAEAGLSPSKLSRWAFDDTVADAPALTLEQRIDAGSDGQDLAVSPDGNHVAFAAGGGNASGYTIVDYGGADFTVTAGAWDTGAYPYSASFSPDGSRLVASNGDQVVAFSTATHAEQQRRAATFGSGCTLGQVERVRVSAGGGFALATASCGPVATTGRLLWFRLAP